ncbi:hypothetical protein MTR67_048166 [Solanum verrucosum]|uniref:Gag-pol polyprotein n=1 Tax=Solanum verrucosum TaxID=315347 RepID=A0AAF0ZX42_SOLVR|nr:hypothetical protein MTR67_048166 [Solanum verrucosum]
MKVCFSRWVFKKKLKPNVLVERVEISAFEGSGANTDKAIYGLWTDSRAAFQVLSQDMTAQAHREVVVSLNPNVCTMTCRVRAFTRMNPLEFYGSMVEEDPQEFIDEVYKVLMIMVVTPDEFEITTHLGLYFDSFIVLNA